MSHTPRFVNTSTGQPLYTILELDKLIKAIGCLAVGIKTKTYRPYDDEEYQKLALSLFRLAGELKTFSNQKMGRMGEKTP